MSKIERSIEVNVPLSTAYNQWTQFEEFPRFMEGVKSVRQIDDTTLEWTAEIAGREHSWMAEIHEQVPDEVISWRSTTGPRNSGLVSFQETGPDNTLVKVVMEWQPDGAIEHAGAALGADDRQVQDDLRRFKEFIESRGVEDGAWRGEVEAGVERQA